MNFFTYLALRFGTSPVGEGILGGLGLILIIVLSPVILLAGIATWFWSVYEEWKEFKEEDV